MRWFCVSLLLAVLSLAVVASAGWPSAAQDKTFAVSILVEHNNVRQKYNVQLLIWDDGLAKLAQDWADKIAASGALPPAHRASGENLFWGTADQWPVKDVLAVWEAESKNYDRATNTCAPGKNCVHFTQVVWHTTTRVGCGIAKGMSKGELTDFIACDYSPPGNTVGQSPFPPKDTTVAATTPAPSPSPIAQCDDLRKSVQQLTAQVEQLKNPNSESAKVATPSPSPSTPPTDPNAKCPTNKYGIELLPIPGKSFCMGKYEVTQAQWKSVMGKNPSRFKSCGDNCPVEQVSWDEVRDFMKKLNADNDGFKYRLPTGDEWEYAGRAGTTGRYYGNVNEIGWFDVYSGRKTHPVGQKQPNAFGLYDISGNVWEWCEDRFEDDEDLRVLRGGSWHSPKSRLRISLVSGLWPDENESYIGFRVLAERPATTTAGSQPAPTASPTPRPVARKIDTFGTTPTPVPTPAAIPNATCEELRKTEQELIAQLEELKKPKPFDPSAKCPANKFGIEFVPIPGQTICLGKYEVTNAQWETLMGNNPSDVDFDGDSLPVEDVSWEEAQKFINKLNAGNDGFKYRLPTEAEWEYACRAGTTGSYYGNVNAIGWHKRNSRSTPHAVGKKEPNAFGLYDMSGNVSEWVQDWYNEKEGERGIRGGSWRDLTTYLRSGTRRGMGSGSSRNYIGFRVAAERAK